MSELLTIGLTEVEWSALAVSLKVSLLCAFLSLPFAVLAGWLLARKEFRGKAVVEAFLHVPMVMPPVTTGYLLLLMFGTNGLLGSWLETLGIRIAFSFDAAVLASIIVSFPLAVRAVKQAVEMVDKRLEDAAEILGASRWRIFFAVTVPLAFPGILSGFLLSFTRSLGEFGATITFAGNIFGETRTIPLALFSAMQTPGKESEAFRLMLLSIVISFIAMLASELVNRRYKKELY
ncbi:molybdate ABC transporter permease subunit [Sunxiuqinia elliptica]|uniref:Molybdenum transport system permease n=1 Tax=Sunxiuqinia elliptica TaxID=655355 RepID=A0A1I2MAS9_9BACT|nr:molybdate ABC transporter permease subunit [Sunxiuqinia elliptica]TDO02537.1 molybdate transport system permease protein [Sunxiuqinia elliptica]TDO58724.1 molybdate transport system permease protein [Sunxiuqinia elliptica]SFF86496.1 molybdate transport system permease protein [Sunxiuqinia elliptica]